MSYARIDANSQLQVLHLNFKNCSVALSSCCLFGSFDSETAFSANATLAKDFEVSLNKRVSMVPTCQLDVQCEKQ